MAAQNVAIRGSTVSEMFKECWSSLPGCSPHLDRGSVVRKMQEMGFDVIRGKKPGDFHKYQMHQWYIWPCINQGRLAYATAQVVDGKFQDHQWFNYTDSGDSALEAAVNRVLGEIQHAND